MPTTPSPTRRTTPHLLGVLVLVLALAACGTTTSGLDPAAPTSATTPAPGTAVGVPDPDSIDPARLEPLDGLPACATPTEVATADAPPDVPLPPEAVVVEASTDEGLTSVRGTSPRTPVEIMVDYLRRDELEVVEAEDEVFESELLLRDGDLRVFVKAQATCARGSAFVLYASTDPELVPDPAGGESD